MMLFPPCNLLSSTPGETIMKRYGHWINPYLAEMFQRGWGEGDKTEEKLTQNLPLTTGSRTLDLSSPHRLAMSIRYIYTRLQSILRSRYPFGLITSLNKNGTRMRQGIGLLVEFCWIENWKLEINLAWAYMDSIHWYAIYILFYPLVSTISSN